MTSGEGEIVVEAGAAGARYWGDLWRYRELLYFLAWRDLLVRYKQTAAGVAWALVRPLLALAVFSFVFGRVAKLPSPDGVPYPVLVFTGLLPWQFVTTALTDAAGSLVSNANLVGKVYFPRLLVPAAAVAVGLADTVLSMLLLLVLMLATQVAPGPRLLLLPVFVALALLAALGAGLWLAALNVRYRDVRLLVPFLVQLSLYASPVGFDSAVVPERWRLLFSFNPLVGVIEGFRYCLLPDAPLDLAALGISASLVVVLLLGGTAYFRSTERAFADVI
jgi:lipopolysaccharide transport system permease protein